MTPIVATYHVTVTLRELDPSTDPAVGPRPAEPPTVADLEELLEGAIELTLDLLANVSAERTDT